jgi:hypothetical protein
MFPVVTAMQVATKLSARWVSVLGRDICSAALLARKISSSPQSHTVARPSTKKGPLCGVKIIDLTRVLAVSES